jgi:SWI/SNF-related matrix-associated actin-dependent regulator of chromatin subfamily A member 5
MEERVLERATQKLKLDQLVIQEGRAQQQQKGKFADSILTAQS